MNIYRSRNNRGRVYAVQYTGENKEEVLKFIERPNMAANEERYLKCSEHKIYPGDWVTRRIYDIALGVKEIDLNFEIYNRIDFSKKYRGKGANIGRYNTETGRSQKEWQENQDKGHSDGVQEKRDKSPTVFQRNISKRVVGNTEITKVSFKSFPRFYKKEKLGIKNNTVREKDTSERFKILEEFSLGVLKNLEVEIINSKTKESFVRKVKDVSNFYNTYIITWKHEKEKKFR